MGYCQAMATVTLWPMATVTACMWPMDKSRTPYFKSHTTNLFYITNWHYTEATIATPLDKWLICFNNVFFCVQRHAAMFVQVYADPFIGERIMNI